MDNSIFLARLLGPTLAIVGIALVVHRKTFASVLQEFIVAHALSYLAGLIALAAGLALVLTHNVWSADWRVLITLIGWIALAKGLMLLLLPQFTNNVGNWFLAHRAAFLASAAFSFVIGAVLCGFGYSA